MGDRRHQGGWDPSYRNLEEDTSEPIPVWDFDTEISQLERDLHANTKVGEHFVKTEGVWVGGSRGGNNPGDWKTEPFEGYVDDFGPDTEKIEKAKSRLLEIVKHSPKSLPKHLAARALTRNSCGNYRYSKTRLFVHEHPILIGIATVGIASSSIYALAEYLSK